jgi:hypothetical protein
VKRNLLLAFAIIGTSFFSYHFAGRTGSEAIAQSASTPGLQPLKMGSSPSVVLSPAVTYTTLGFGSLTPPNTLVSSGTLRWQGLLEITTPSSPSDITYEFVDGIGTAPSCSSGTFIQQQTIPAGTLKASATQDVPIDGWIGPSSGANLKGVNNIRVCAQVASTTSGNTIISHPTILTKTNVGSAWVADLTSYPSTLTFTGSNPGIVSCQILNTFSTPVPLSEDGVTWTGLTSTNDSCISGKQFSYDPTAANAIVVMRGGMMKIGYPCLQSGTCSAGTLEYVEYGLMSSPNSTDTCNTVGLNIDPHSIDGAEIGGTASAQPIVGLLTYQNDPGVLPVYIHLCARACVSDNGTSCRSTPAATPSPPAVVWSSSQVDLVTKPY